MRTPQLLLQDILDAIAVIQQYTPPTEQGFNSDPPVQSHIARHLSIIGEAATRVPKALKDQYPQVPWRVISDMRNILVHAYFAINWHRVYETARWDVPPLETEIRKILAALPP